MSFILLGILNSQGGGGFEYWLSTLGSAGYEDGVAAVSDASGNSYSIGSSAAGAGSYDALIVKFNSAGTIQWQRVFGDSAFNPGIAIAYYSEDAIYITSQLNVNIIIAKYNSSGAIQWQKSLGGTGNDYGQALTTDSDGNVYLGGATDQNVFGGFRGFLVKYNSSGVIQWQRVFGSSFQYGQAVASDSSNNIYLSTRNLFGLVKYNSSGTVQWQRTLAGAYQGYPEGLAVDSSDNVYIYGRHTGAGLGDRDVVLAKYNSSGTLQWQRALGGSNRDENIESGNPITIDSEDNIYVTGKTASEGEGSTDIFIAKYNSSGTIQWQRTLGTVGQEFDGGITIDSSGAVVYAGRTVAGAGSSDLLLARLPSDGSLTGTYALAGYDFVYVASTLSAITTTITGATSSHSSASASRTAGTSSFTDTGVTLTQNIIGL